MCLSLGVWGSKGRRLEAIGGLVESLGFRLPSRRLPMLLASEKFSSLSLCLGLNFEAFGFGRLICAVTLSVGVPGEVG